VLDSLAEAGYAALPGERFRIATGPGVRITCASLDPAEAGKVAARRRRGAAGGRPPRLTAPPGITGRLDRLSTRCRRG